MFEITKFWSYNITLYKIISTVLNTCIFPLFRNSTVHVFSNTFSLITDRINVLAIPLFQLYNSIWSFFTRYWPQNYCISPSRNVSTPIKKVRIHSLRPFVRYTSATKIKRFTPSKRLSFIIAADLKIILWKHFLVA